MLNDEEMLVIRDDILPHALKGNGRAKALSLLGDKLLDVLLYRRYAVIII